MKVSETLPRAAYVVLTVCTLGLIIVFTAMPSKAKAAVNARLTEILTRQPLAFEANQGQTGPAVKYLARGPGYKMFFTPAETVLTLRKSPRTKTVILRMRLEGAAACAEVSGINLLPGKVNYFTGNDPKQWRMGVPTFAKVKYKNIYPGIDLVFYGRQGRMEYDFKVYPGGDPRSISLCFTGADKISLDQDGNLLLHTPGGVLTQSVPLAYQAADGRRDKVSCNYTLLGKDRVCFKVGGYDPKKTLVIDPVLVYSTYLGGQDYEEAFGLAVDDSGCVYITGETYSADFPTKNAFQAAEASVGSSDVFLTKLSADGSAFVYSTYLGGGGGMQTGYDVAVDSSGCAYVTGYTSSPDFPILGAIQDTWGGASDVFLTKFSADGANIVYSTYLGDTENERARSVAVDSSGNAYLTGWTWSSNFPTKEPYQGAPGSTLENKDVFAAKVNSSGSALVYSTFLGGNSGEEGRGLAVDSSGCAYITGYTNSHDFPTAKSLQDDRAGLTDNAFITKLSADGSSLKYSTYLGGTRADRGLGVAVDPSGRAYVTGWTESDDFPTKNAFQGSLAEPPWEYPTDAPPVGYKDAFAVVLKADGSEIITSTYLGGSHDDQAVGVALDGNGLVYLAGTTEAADFPTFEPLQAVRAGRADAFLTILVLDGSEPVFSTYFGGTGDDRAAGLAIDENMAVYLVGSTESDDFPTAGPYQSARAGDQDVFVVKIDAGDPDNNEENQGGGSSGGTIQVSGSEETSQGWFFSGGCFISEAGNTSGMSRFDISGYIGLIPVCLFFAGLFFCRRL